MDTPDLRKLTPEQLTEWSEKLSAAMEGQALGDVVAIRDEIQRRISEDFREIVKASHT